MLLMLMTWHDDDGGAQHHSSATHWDAGQVDEGLLAIDDDEHLGGGDELQGWDA
jgi:hypothetical protein